MDVRTHSGGTSNTLRVYAGQQRTMETGRITGG